MKKLFTILFLLLIAAASVNAQAVGDYGSNASGNWGTNATWVVCVSAGTWAGATTATSAPTSSTNVWVRSPNTVTVEASAKTCANLTVENGATIISNSNYPGSPSFVYVRVYGTTVTINGNFGNAADDYNTLSMEAYTSSTTMTITGTGTAKICRIRPGSSITSKTIVIDMDAKLTYTGSTYGGGGAGFYSSNSSNNNITFTVNSGKTLTCVDKCNFQTASSGSNNGSATTTFNINGTLTMQGTANIALGIATGYTCTFNVGGTVNSYNFNIPTGSLGTNTVNVNAGGLLKGTTGNFDAGTICTTNVAGTVDFNTSSTSTRNLGVLNVNNGGKLRFQDNAWVSGGTVTLNAGSTVEYFGSSSLTRSTPTTYKNLLITNSAGVTMGANFQVDGTLTLSGANISTGSNTLYISSTGSVTRNSGQVVGNFKKYIGTGSPSVNFEIGDASNYTPINFSFTNVSVAGDLTAKSTAGNHSDILNSGINASKCVSRYWTMTNSGMTMDSCSAVFNFVAGDVIGGANTSSFIAKKYNGATWSSLGVGTMTSTSTQTTGITSFSDFAIGEPASSDPTISLTGSLSNFGQTVVNTTSAEQSYTVAGANLTADITVTPPTGFEISLGTGGGFVATNPITLTQSGGTVPSTTIYVRFAPTTTGPISGNITHASAGATTQNQAASGTSIATQPTTAASNLVFSDIAPTSMTVTWTNGDGAERLVIVRSGSAVATAPSDGTTYTDSSVFGAGTAIGAGYAAYAGSGNSFSLTGLTEGTLYYFAVYEYNGSGGTENYMTTAGTGVRGANIIYTAQVTGNWSDAGSWVGGILPTSTDNVKINSNSTITVDDANAACRTMTFNSATTARLAFGASGVLSIYGDFVIYSASTNCINTWAAGGKMKFSGSVDQLINNLSTSKTSTSQTTFYEIQIDKTAGKVYTSGTNDYSLCVGRSLEIINGTFELGAGDDILGFDVNTSGATTPTITIQSGGTWNFIGGNTYVRSGTSGTGMVNPIGKLTVSGTISSFVTNSTNGFGFSDVDILNGGNFNVTSGWGATQLFRPGTMTIYSGGTLNTASTSNFWYTGSTLTINAGGTLKSTASTTTLPTTLNNSGLFWYARTTGGSDQNVYDMDYSDLKISVSGNNKNLALAADRTVSGNLTIENSGSLVLSSTGKLIVNGTIYLTSGTVTTGSTKLSLASSGSVSQSSGYVIGNFEKYIGTGATSKTFEVGTANGYSPVTVAFGNVTVDDNLVAAAVQSTHPNASTPANTLQRYWTLTKGTNLAFDNYSATFTYLSADFNSGVTEASDEATLVVGKYGTSWSFPTIGTRTVGTESDGGSIQVTGVTSFSDFVIGKDQPSLPVELTSFTSTVSGRTVQLKWATATEKNSASFDIERTNGSGWMKVASVRAAGNSNSSKSYSYNDNQLQSGSYQYRLKMIDNDGSFDYSAVIEAVVELPRDFALSQNYPNPFNPSTRIDFQLPQGANIAIDLFSILGEKAGSIYKGYKDAGYHSIDVDAGKFGLQSGVYIYRLQIVGGEKNGFNLSKKMVLTK